MAILNRRFKGRAVTLRAMLVAVIAISASGQAGAEGGDERKYKKKSNNMALGIAAGIAGIAILNSLKKKRKNNPPVRIYERQPPRYKSRPRRTRPYTPRRRPRAIFSLDTQRIQTSLATLGYNVGRADGLMGASTNAGISRFQLSLGQPATGYLTPLQKNILFQRAQGSPVTPAGYPVAAPRPPVYTPYAERPAAPNRYPVAAPRPPVYTPYAGRPAAPNRYPVAAPAPRPPVYTSYPVRPSRPVYTPVAERPETLDVLNQQIVKLISLRRYAEAMKVASRAHALAKREFGPDHPKVALALASVADIYAAQGSYRYAEPYYAQALVILEKTPGPAHPKLARTLSALAMVIGKQGRHPEANALQQRARALAQRYVKNVPARSRFAYRKSAPKPVRRKPAYAPRPPAPMVLPPPRPPLSGARAGSADLAPALPVPVPIPIPVIVPGKQPANPPKSEVFESVTVFYGTDRKRKEDARRVRYGAGRGRRLEHGQAVVTIPRKIHAKGQIERPREMVVLGITLYTEDEDPAKHFTIYSIDALSKDELLRRISAKLATSRNFKDHAFVFVHGYNVSFDAALYRTAQISYDLGFDGVPFLYSWPSQGQLASYETDQNSAEQAQPYLKDFINLVINNSKAKNIHIIAHSMGNMPLLRTLKDIKLSSDAIRRGVKISQIILAAPDIDRDVFLNLSSQIVSLSKGITLYASANDKAMMASRTYAGGIPRAGDVPEDGPVISAGIDTIDISNISTDVLALNHSEYAEKSKLLLDIGKILSTGIRPPTERIPSLKPVTIKSGTYWVFPE